MEKSELSVKGFVEIFVIELVSLTSLILPAVLVGFADKRGMIVLLTASVLFLIQASLYWLLAKQEGKTPDELLQRAKGFWSKTGKCLYAVRFFIHGLFLSVILVDLIKKVLLPASSEAEILIPFLLLVITAGGKTFLSRRRIMGVLFPCIFIPLILVLLLALFRLDYSSLSQQLWGTGIKTWNRELISGVYGILTLYQPVEFILFLLPKVRSKENQKKMGKYIIGACLLAFVLNVMIYVAAVGLMGSVRVGKELWSALYIMQSIRLPGRFLERLDILFLVFWIFSTFGIMFSYYYYGSLFGPQEKAKKRLYTVFWFLGMIGFTIFIKTPKMMFELFMPYKMWIDFPLSCLLLYFIYKREVQE